MRTSLIIFHILLYILAFGHEAIAQDKVRWMTWDEAMQKSKAKKKKILVDIYTPWCGWCKKMDKTTYQEATLADYINENYYPVKFDAQTMEDISLNGKKYSFVKNGAQGYNELAVELLQGKLSFPSTVFMDENFQIIQAIPGYQDVNTFGMITTYFASNSHKSIPWQRYSENFIVSQSQAKAKKRGN